MNLFSTKDCSQPCFKTRTLLGRLQGFWIQISIIGKNHGHLLIISAQHSWRQPGRKRLTPPIILTVTVVVHVAWYHLQSSRDKMRFFIWPVHRTENICQTIIPPDIEGVTGIQIWFSIDRDSLPIGGACYGVWVNNDFLWQNQVISSWLYNGIPYSIHFVLEALNHTTQSCKSGRTQYQLLCGCIVPM